MRRSRGGSGGVSFCVCMCRGAYTDGGWDVHGRRFLSCVIR